MDAATQAALRRLAGMLRDHLSTPTTGSSATRLGYGLPAPVLQAGTAAVDDALAATARGHTLADTDAAWLSAVLVIPDVRDYAWNGCDGSEHQRRLWIDMTRRATPATTPAPAFLLAVAPTFPATAHWPASPWTAACAANPATPPRGWPNGPCRPVLTRNSGTPQPEADAAEHPSGRRPPPERLGGGGRPSRTASVVAKAW